MSSMGNLKMFGGGIDLMGGIQRLWIGTDHVQAIHRWSNSSEWWSEGQCWCQKMSVGEEGFQAVDGGQAYLSPCQLLTWNGRTQAMEGKF